MKQPLEPYVRYTLYLVAYLSLTPTLLHLTSTPCTQFLYQPITDPPVYMVHSPRQQGRSPRQTAARLHEIRLRSRRTRVWIRARSGTRERTRARSRARERTRARSKRTRAWARAGSHQCPQSTWSDGLRRWYHWYDDSHITAPLYSPSQYSPLYSLVNTIFIIIVIIIIIIIIIISTNS